MVFITIDRTSSFHSYDPPGVVELQQEHWSPLLKWARETFNVEVNTTDALFVVPHSPATIKKFDEILSAFDPWQMAGKLFTASLVGL